MVWQSQIQRAIKSICIYEVFTYSCIYNPFQIQMKLESMQMLHFIHDQNQKDALLTLSLFGCLPLTYGWNHIQRLVNMQWEIKRQNEQHTMKWNIWFSLKNEINITNEIYLHEFDVRVEFSKIVITIWELCNVLFGFPFILIQVQ